MKSKLDIDIYDAHELPVNMLVQCFHLMDRVKDGVTSYISICDQINKVRGYRYEFDANTKRDNLIVLAADGDRVVGFIHILPYFDKNCKDTLMKIEQFLVDDEYKDASGELNEFLFNWMKRNNLDWKIVHLNLVVLNPN